MSKLHPIYVLEGADGTGKSTLANTIAEAKKASVLHCFFDKEWDIKQHHLDMWKAAKIIAQWRPVVLDRWAPSEQVYGDVFRMGPGYDVMGLLWELEPELENVTWVYCRNDNAVENHLKNSEKREEMFGDMTAVVEHFDALVKGDRAETSRQWLEYDFDKVNMYDFVESLPGKNYN